MSTIQEDYAEYTDEHNLVQPEGNTSDNGIRFTAQFVRALHRHGKLDTQACAEITSAIRECELQPGLFNRAPLYRKQQSHDDYRGLALISYYCDTRISSRILSYGRKQIVRYTYDNTADPKLSHILQGMDNPWLGRFPSMIAMHKVVVGEKLNCAYIEWIRRDIRQFSVEQDGIIFIYFLRILMNKIPGLTTAFQEWEDNVRRYYPSGVGQVLEQYYGHSHADGVWLRGDFGQ